MKQPSHLERWEIIRNHVSRMMRCVNLDVNLDVNDVFDIVVRAAMKLPASMIRSMIPGVGALQHRLESANFPYRLDTRLTWIRITNNSPHLNHGS